MSCTEEENNPHDIFNVIWNANRQYGDSLAVMEYPTRQGLQYKTLYQRVCNVAKYMATHGVSKGDRIAVIARNRTEVMELHYAIAALHAVVVNVNIHLAPTEMHHQLSDSGTVIVFAEADFQPILQQALSQATNNVQQIIWIGSDSAMEAQPMQTSTDIKQTTYDHVVATDNGISFVERLRQDQTTLFNDSDALHMYYTSGTTGKAKGAVLSHKIVHLHAEAAIQEMEFTGDDTWGHFSPMFHLVDVFGIYSLTMVGGRHIILRTFTARDALRAIEKYRVTCTNVASTAVTMMINNPLIKTTDLTSLRFVSCGGSAQSTSIVKRACAEFGCQFFLSYGMTECCGKISMSILPSEAFHQLSDHKKFELMNTSGRPFTLMEVKCVDADGNELEKGVEEIGEVYVKGPTVFAGYWNLPQETADSFVDGWFKTGDLARIRNDGYLEIVDRKKDMILVGAENVYSSEVECVLHSHPAVHQAAVFGIPNGVLGEMVAAAVVLRSDAVETKEQELKTWCDEQLAYFKRPTVIHIIDQMPITGSGKILKTKLRERFSDSKSDTCSVPNRSSERAIDITPDFVKEVRKLMRIDDEQRVEFTHTNIILADGGKSATAQTVEAIQKGYRCLFVLTPEDFENKDLEQLEKLTEEHQCCLDVGIVKSSTLQDAESAVSALYHLREELGLPPFGDVIIQASDPPATQMRGLEQAGGSQQEQKVTLQQQHRSKKRGKKTRRPTAVHSESEKRQEYEDLIKREVSTILNRENVDCNAPLMNEGLTSVGAVSLTSQLEKVVGFELPGTLIFDYPTISHIVEYFQEREVQDPKPPAQRHQNLLPEIIMVFKEILNVEEVDMQAPLMTIGLNSTLAVTATERLAKTLNLELPGTLLFDYPTIAAVDSYISEELMGSEMEQSSISESLSTSLETKNPVYVVSYAQRLPGHSKLAGSASDLVSRVPLERWDVVMESGKGLESQFGAFVRDASLFDPTLFQISPSEAILIDPQQRVVLDTFTEALSPLDGQYPKESGIYVGVSQLEYARLTLEHSVGLNAYYATGAHLSVASGRISYLFGFTGAALTVDTACSSSLVTTHLAAKALEEGEIKMSSSMGVNLTLVSSWTQACHRAGMLAEDGRCKTLDTEADGYVRAEAACAIILLNELDSSQHQPLGIIRVAGTGVNQDGQSSSLTAPTGPAQQAVIRSALDASSMSPQSVHAVQMHGTGTSLGDPIEVGALLSAMKPTHEAGQLTPLSLTAKKSEMGHAEPAAGLVGFIQAAKTVLDRSIQPVLHLRNVNPQVISSIRHSSSGNAGSSIQMPRQHKSLISLNENICASISAFAFMGTNSHALIERDTSSDVTLGTMSKTELELLETFRSYHWICPKAHPFLHNVKSTDDKVTIEIRLRNADLDFLYGHQVNGKVLFPATGMLEFALSCGIVLMTQGSGSLGALTVTSFSIMSPVIIKQPDVNCSSLICEVDPKTGKFIIMHLTEEGASLMKNAEGSFGLLSEASSTNILQSQSILGRILQENLKANQNDKPCNYVGKLANVTERRTLQDGFNVSPMLMDACLHLGVVDTNLGAKIPINVGAFTKSKTHTSQLNEYYASINLSPVPDQADKQDFKLIHGIDGSQICLQRLKTKVLPLQQNSLESNNIACGYNLEWLASHPCLQTSSALHVSVPLKSVFELSSEQFHKASFSFGAQKIVRKLDACNDALKSLQLVQDFTAKAKNCYINTVCIDPRQTNNAGFTRSSKCSATVTGLLKTAATENVNSILTASLQDPYQTKASFAKLKECVGSLATQGINTSSALVPRVVPHDVDVHPDRYQITPSPRGSFQTLVAKAIIPRISEVDEVAVQVKAVGINFRDVLNVLGMYPGDPGPPGSDCAGVVIATGKAVNNFRPGDLVFGLAPGSLGTCVIVKSDLLTQKPSILSFSEASTLPTIFLTANLALNVAGNMSSKDSVLIHAGTGGVGLAAMQYIQHRGAQCFTTAGSSQKRSFLRRAGCSHSSNSRTLDFMEDVAVQGGASIILNSLTSSGMIGASLSVLSGGGKLIEISKRDIWSHCQIHQERPDVQYSILALDFLPRRTVKGMLSDLSSAAAKQEISPLRSTCFGIHAVKAAFKYLASAQHIGKIITTSPMSRMEKQKSGALMITGGLGGLGMLIAEFAISHNWSNHVLLTSRTGKGSFSPSSLFSSSGQITIIKGDSSFEEDSFEILNLSGASSPYPLKAIIHASGVLEDSMIPRMNPQKMRSVFATKASILDSFTLTNKLHALNNTIVFSSIASLVGAAGQSNYVSANSLLDMWTFVQEQMGTMCSSIQWGAWSDVGMATKSVLDRLDRIGQGYLKPEEGLSALHNWLVEENTSHAQLSQRSSVFTVNPFQWEKYLQNMEPIPDLYAEFEHLQSKHKKVILEDQQVTIESRTKVGKEELNLEKIQEELLDATKEIIGKSIDIDEPLISGGLDSLGAVEFVNLISRRFGLALPSTLIFDYPTISSLAVYLHKELSPMYVQPLIALDQSLAIKGGAYGAQIGVSAIVSKDHCESKTSMDLIIRVPLSRWDTNEASKIGRKVATQFGAFLQDIECFDSQAFGVTHQEAMVMDPQHRLLLEMSAMAFQQRPESLQDSSETGVFFGISWTEYHKLCSQSKLKVSPYTAQGAVLSVACGRVSYHLGLKGASISVDTACSSSLIAMNAAWEYSTTQQVPALVGGINMMLLPSTTRMFEAAQMLSPDGRCKALDASADGYVRSEGCSIVLLNPDPIDEPLAYLISGAVNQDGKSSSLTAPNGLAQKEVIRKALKKADVKAEGVSVLQMHGTGTALGDPIEFGAATTCLLGEARNRPLNLFTSKATYGHSEPASGIIGFLSGIQTLMQAKCTQSTHVRTVNPHIQALMEMSYTKGLTNNNISISKSSFGCPVLPSNDDLKMATSAFAFQGTNAHVIASLPCSRKTMGNSPTLEFQKSEYWPTLKLKSYHTAVQKVNSSKLCFLCRLDHPVWAFIRDHVVKTRILVPGAMFMELAFSTAQMCNQEQTVNNVLALTDISIPHPFILSTSSPEACLEVVVDLKSRQIFVQDSVSRRQNLTASIVQTASRNALKSDGGKGLTLLWTQCNEKAGIMATVETNPERIEPHPAEIDCAFQLGALKEHSQDLCLRVPVGADYYSSSRRGATHMVYAWAENIETSTSNSEERKGNFCLSCESGYSVQVHGLMTKTLAVSKKHSQEVKIQDCMYVLESVVVHPSLQQMNIGQEITLEPNFRSVAKTTVNEIGLLQSFQRKRGSALTLETAFGMAQLNEALQTASWGIARSLREEWNQSSVTARNIDYLAASRLARHSTKRYRFRGNSDSGDVFGESTQSQCTEKAILFKDELSALREMRLTPEPRGSLNNLMPMPVSTENLGSKEISVAVKAVGLNFRDVLNILGMYPGDPGPPGGDCAGIVTHAGSEVEYSVGESVFGLAPGCLGTQINASSKTMVPMPHCLTFEEASTMPTVFITTDLALNGLSNIDTQDTVLLHAATGGVGLAAIQTAQSKGARLHLTAGSPLKRYLARQLGSTTISSSRDVQFVEEISLRDGVTVVLNSLTSTGMVAATLATLTRGGSFIEISKRDIWSHGHIHKERPDVGYHLLAVDFLPESVVYGTMKRIAAKAAKGILSPLPNIAHGIHSFVAALRQMTQARHIGKVVLENRSKEVHRIWNGSALIFGGLGAIGGKIIQWLVETGFNHICVIGRTPRQTSNISTKALSGDAVIEAVQCDLTSTEDATMILNKKPFDLLIHASGVIKDALIQNQTPQFARLVTQSKLSCLALLEAFIQLQGISQGVVFSSVASLLGSSGQTTYAGSNAALDAWSTRVSRLGLPMVSAQWGAWAEIGMATRNKRLEQKIKN